MREAYAAWLHCKQNNGTDILRGQSRDKASRALPPRRTIGRRAFVQRMPTDGTERGNAGAEAAGHCLQQAQRGGGAALRGRRRRGNLPAVSVESVLRGHVWYATCSSASSSRAESVSGEANHGGPPMCKAKTMKTVLPVQPRAGCARPISLYPTVCSPGKLQALVWAGSPLQQSIHAPGSCIDRPIASPPSSALLSKIACYRNFRSFEMPHRGNASDRNRPCKPE
mmetsp:Transcript_37079/g.109329  ORF Transcript_37079/g.109329 Transcript_37079/m.109329 type:complete len:225 (+) Transcript_37079:265-939(+)